MKDERRKSRWPSVKSVADPLSHFPFPISHFKKGFTLMELLLVIVITLIISAVSIPIFVQSLEGNQLNTAAKNVGRMHRYARAMSVLRGTPASLNYSATNQVLTVTLGTESAPLVKREIPEKIEIIDFTLLPDEQFDEFPSIVYTGGQCVDYAVTLRDSKDNEILLTIDGIDGSVKFEDQ